MNRSLWAFIRDRERRLIFTAAVSFLLNLLYALYNGALGVMERSIWFVTMFAYYAVLAAMRFSAVLYSRRNGKEDAFAARLTGIMLVLLSAVLAGVIYLSLSQNIAVRYGTIVMITIATYTFTKITMAVIRAAKGRKDLSPLFAAIRCIGYAEVAASLFSMQRSMLVSFKGMSEREIRLMNIMTGSAVWLFVLVLGIIMLRKAGKEYGRI